MTDKPSPFALPRKVMTEIERRFLKLAADELASTKPGGTQALAALLDLVASWHGDRTGKPFHEYGRGWVAEGNARHPAAYALLRDLFGLNNEPDPRRAA
ncbi:hypothetical protein L682_23265 [Aquipseudomonas alcaligenes OT 69]|nr:hypothetical protein L682_23265 [Pseudomonas alcaligenes OT 69]